MGPVAHHLPAPSPVVHREASQLPRALMARHGKAATAQTWRRGAQAAVCMVAAAPPERTREAEGHSALDLGAVGDLAPQQMAQLLRLAHIRSVNDVQAPVLVKLDMRRHLFICTAQHLAQEGGDWQKRSIGSRSSVASPVKRLCLVTRTSVLTEAVLFNDEPHVQGARGGRGQQ